MLDLITQFWDDIPNSTDAIPIPDWHRIKLEQRVRAANANPDAAIAWEEVRKRLRDTA